MEIINKTIRNRLGRRDRSSGTKLNWFIFCSYENGIRKKLHEIGLFDE